MQNKGEGEGAGRRVRGRKKGRQKRSLFGGRWKEQGRLEESEKRRWSGGLPVCFVGERGGPMPFLLDRLNWFNLVVLIIIIIAIRISIPDPVAVLGGILPPGYGSPLPARRLALV